MAENLRREEKVRRKLNREEERKEDKENELLCERKLLVRDNPVIPTKDERTEPERPAAQQNEQPESEGEEAIEKGEVSWFNIKWEGIYNGLVQVYTVT